MSVPSTQSLTQTPGPQASNDAAASLIQRIEGSRLFQSSVIFIIVLSALAIGAKTYDLPPLVSQLISLLDYAITLFFLIEIILRFSAHRDRRRFLANG